MTPGPPRRCVLSPAASTPGTAVGQHEVRPGPLRPCTPAGPQVWAASGPCLGGFLRLWTEHFSEEIPSSVRDPTGPQLSPLRCMNTLQPPPSRRQLGCTA